MSLERRDAAAELLAEEKEQQRRAFPPGRSRRASSVGGRGPDHSFRVCGLISWCARARRSVYGPKGRWCVVCDESVISGVFSWGCTVRGGGEG